MQIINLLLMISLCFCMRMYIETIGLNINNERIQSRQTHINILRRSKIVALTRQPAVPSPLPHTSQPMQALRQYPGVPASRYVTNIYQGGRIKPSNERCTCRPSRRLGSLISRTYYTRNMVQEKRHYQALIAMTKRRCDVLFAMDARLYPYSDINIIAGRYQ